MPKIGLFLIVFLLVGAGCSSAVTPEISDAEVVELEALIEDFVMENADEIVEMGADEVLGDLDDDLIEHMDKVAGGDLEDEPVPAARIGAYLDYSEQAVAEAVERGDKVVLFFYAVWCPFCKQLDEELYYHPDGIPEGVTILKTDFDSESVLKNQYGVRFQHTFVQIDSDGEMVTSWLGGGIPELELNLQ
jgi:hypothetical protein